MKYRMRVLILSLSFYLAGASASLYAMENYAIEVQHEKSAEERLSEINQILQSENKTSQEIQMDQLSYIIKEFPTNKRVGKGVLDTGTKEGCWPLGLFTLQEAYQELLESSRGPEDKILALRQIATQFGCLERALMWATKEALETKVVNRESLKRLCEFFSSIEPLHTNYSTFSIHQKASLRVALSDDEDMIDFFMNLYTKDLYILEGLCEIKSEKLHWFFETYFMGRPNEDKTVKERDRKKIITLLERCGFLKRDKEPLTPEKKHYPAIFPIEIDDLDDSDESDESSE